MGGLDRIVASIAAGQHGVVARWQLLAAGISARWIEKGLDKGSPIRVYPGVYRVGHIAPSVEADYMAAVLACGEGAVLSGRAAACLLGLIRSGPHPDPEVTTRTERRIPGIRTHRARGASSRDRRTWRGMPITSAARTLVDLAAVVAPGQLAHAVHEAGIRHGTTPDEIEEVLAFRPTSPGAGVLRTIIHGDQGKTLSGLERRFLKLLRDARLPLPITNRLAGGRLVDCRWPEHQLTVELDGYRYHSSRHAWEKDRQRERDAYARGDEFRRYTWTDVVERPEVVLRELRPIIGKHPA
jgi:very-short-patch-repair endonuclease